MEIKNVKKLAAATAMAVITAPLYAQSTDLSSQGLSFLQQIQTFLNNAKTYIGGILAVVATVMFIILLLSKGATGQVSWVRIGVTAICAFLAIALLS
jgi:hypothetical protein